MNITYTHKNIPVEDELKTYIEERIEPITKHYEHINSAHINIKLGETQGFRVNVELVSPKVRFEASEEADTIQNAVVEISKELKTQIDHKKDKSITLSRRRARSMKKKITIDPNARF